MKRLLWLLVPLPAIVAAHYALTVSVDVPYFDEWHLVPFVERWVSGAAGWKEIFRPYVAERVSYLLPLHKLVVVASARFLDWDVRLPIGIGFVFLAGTAAMLCHHAWAQTRSVFLLLLVSLLLFSLRQFESLIGPWGLETFSCSFFTVATLFLLSTYAGARSLVLAVACAACASLAFTNGLLAWPLGLALLVAQKRTRHALAWAASAALFLGAYFRFLYVFVPHVKNPDVTALLVAKRFFSLFGGVFSMDKSIVTAGAAGAAGEPDFRVALLVGALVCGLVGWLLWSARTQLRRFLFPIGVVLYALGTALLIAYGRADFGLAQVFASRYTPIALLMFAAALTLLWQLQPGGDAAPRLQGAVASVTLLAAAYGTLTEISMAPHRRGYLETWAGKVRQYASGADLTNPHFKPEEIHQYASVLDRLKLSVFRR